MSYFEGKDYFDVSYNGKLVRFKIQIAKGKVFMIIVGVNLLPVERDYVIVVDENDDKYIKMN
jgi:hypothetical protein